MTADEIKAHHSIQSILEKRGIGLEKKGSELVCCCPIHKEKTPSFSVNPEKQLFYCFGCGVNGSVIDLVMNLDGLSTKEAMESLGGKPQLPSRYAMKAPTKPQSQPEPAKAKPKLECSYSYKDEHGNELYQAVRLIPKDFRQRHQTDGKWVWNMEGVRRVLYNLPMVLKAKQPIWIVEGEKDADNLIKLGIVATCNVGGAGKWLSGYSDCLKDKEVILCGDNDDPGKKHMDGVFESLAGKVKSVKRVVIPEPHKDVSDYLGSGLGMAENLLRMAQDALSFDKGLDIPIYSMNELEGQYREFLATSSERCLDLGQWLPSLGKQLRPLVPGEVMTILANTGIGKTAILQNIAHSISLQTLIFEIELPGSLMFERFISIDQRMGGEVVELKYRKGEIPAWKEGKKLDHIHACTLSGIDTDKIEELIYKSELKIGCRPAVVMIDYIGLVRNKGGSRYEIVSGVSEKLKEIAKKTNTIVIASSQMHRKEDGDGEVFLHDAKDSGSVENSSGTMLGVWRSSENKEQMFIKIMKSTKGVRENKLKGATTIPCYFRGSTLRITEEIA